MKRLSFLLLFFIVFSYSCKKNNEVHFYGKIALDCQNQIPIKNCTVEIDRIYDTGRSRVENIGSVVTDNNGKYSLVTSVSQRGSLQFYRCRIVSSQYTGGASESYENGDEIEMNITLPKACTYKFHIKNTAPSNSGDVFEDLQVSDEYGKNMKIIASNLGGANVDTNVYQFYDDPGWKVFKYAYSINGYPMMVDLDTLPATNCSDTVTVDVFY
ncbi:MAG: hypothetical protein KAG64_05025 [Bacteroidales bacterium]|nr:hypothetical protein [Bacteroidales bacterium]